MKSVLLPLAMMLVLALAIGRCSDSSAVEKTDPVKMTLLLQEQQQPGKYLTVNSEMRPDDMKVKNIGLFWDAEYAPDGHTIYGKIKNTASLAQFTELVLSVSYYTANDTHIETREFVLHDVYKPHSEKDFELKVYPPDAMAKYKVEIKGATVVN